MAVSSKLLSTVLWVRLYIASRLVSWSQPNRAPGPEGPLSAPRHRPEPIRGHQQSRLPPHINGNRRPYAPGLCTFLPKHQPVWAETGWFMNTRTICHHYCGEEIVPILPVLLANIANIMSNVQLKHSTNPSLSGWYGVVLVLCDPHSIHSSCMILFSNSHPWLECITIGIPKRHTIWLKNASATDCAVISGNGHASVHLEKQSKKYLFPLVVVSDMSSRSMATRSHLCRTSTWPMGALRGHGDLSAKQIVQESM